MSVMGAWKAYSSALLFASAICLPLSVWASKIGGLHHSIDRHHLRLILIGHFIASTISKRLVYGRLGSMNVSNMTTSRLWTSPCKTHKPLSTDGLTNNVQTVNAFCTLKSLFSDPGDTSFKVSGTFVSPTEERYASRRKPLLKRMLNLTMGCYAAYFVVTAALLAVLFTSVAYQHSIVGGKRVHMHTGAALRLIDLALASIVPVRYMIFPPSLPDRQALLEKDAHGVSRSQKKAWTRRDGGSKISLMLQLAVILVFDWL